MSGAGPMVHDFAKSLEKVQPLLGLQDETCKKIKAFVDGENGGEMQDGGKGAEMEDSEKTDGGQEPGAGEE
jgi:hypothetical protein